MIKSTLKVAGSIAKAAKSKSAPDIVKASVDTAGLIHKAIKPKKKAEEKRKQKMRG